MPTTLDVVPLKTRTNFSLEFDAQKLDEIRENERIAKLLRVLRRARIITIDEGMQQSSATITMRLGSIVRFPDGPSAVVETLDRVYNHIAMSPDPCIPRIAMSHSPVDKMGGRYSMGVEVRWPECYREAANFATAQMQQFAAIVELNGHGLDRENDMVFVAADENGGLSVQTNPVGGCAIETDGQAHEGAVQTGIAELWQHNIYNPSQQIACLVGAVAFAHAEEHLSRR